MCFQPALIICQNSIRINALFDDPAVDRLHLFPVISIRVDGIVGKCRNTEQGQVQTAHAACNPLILHRSAGRELGSFVIIPLGQGRRTSVICPIIIGRIIAAALVVYRREVYDFAIVGSCHGRNHIALLEPVVVSAVLRRYVLRCPDHIGGTGQSPLLVNQVEGAACVLFAQCHGRVSIFCHLALCVLHRVAAIIQCPDNLIILGQVHVAGDQLHLLGMAVAVGQNVIVVLIRVIDGLGISQGISAVGLQGQGAMVVGS